MLTQLEIISSPMLTTVPANAFSEVTTSLGQIDLSDNSIETQYGEKG